MLTFLYKLIAIGFQVKAVEFVLVEMQLHEVVAISTPLSFANQSLATAWLTNFSH